MDFLWIFYVFSLDVTYGYSMDDCFFSFVFVSSHCDDMFYVISISMMESWWWFCWYAPIRDESNGVDKNDDNDNEHNVMTIMILIIIMIFIMTSWLIMPSMM